MKALLGVKVFYLYSRGGARHPENSFRLQPCLLQLRQQLQTNTQIHRTVTLRERWAFRAQYGSLFSQKTECTAFANSSGFSVVYLSIRLSDTFLALFRDNAVVLCEIFQHSTPFKNRQKMLYLSLISQSHSKTLAQTVKPKLKTQTDKLCPACFKLYSEWNRKSPCSAGYQTQQLV